MLFGTYQHNMDAKNRIFIPAKHREELGEGFVVAKSAREKCLRIYSRDQWLAYMKEIKSMNGKNRDAVLRWLSMDAVQQPPDTQGRIVLSPTLIKHAQLEKNAYIIGCGDYAEIWSEANYQAMIDSVDGESMNEILESFGL